MIEESGPQTSQWNMEIDSQSLENVIRPTLRFYEWEGLSATYGYFLEPSDYFNVNALEKEKLNLARRPTGGGIIFHIDDLSFSIIVPSSHPFYSFNSLNSYKMINSLVVRAIQKVIPACPLTLQEHLLEAPRGGFCMAKPTKFDILFQGKKVGGAAQRKTKKGLLHQCSLCLKLPDPHWLKKILKPDSKAIEEIFASSYPLGVHLKNELKLQIAEETLESAS